VSSSKPIVAVIDYDRGNLHSVVRAFEAAGATVHLAKTADELKRASHVVLPGVGAYKDCMETFVATGLQDPVAAFIASGKPFLGICLGMQLLLERSFEFGVTQGLGILPGEVLPFPVNELPDESTLLKIPHMGWNAAVATTESDLEWDGLGPSPFFYFVHSYGVREFPLASGDTGRLRPPRVTWSEAGDGDRADRFVAAVENGPLSATQFHPEKSGEAGLMLLKNWLDTL